MSNYPDGAEFDTNAPYNQKDPIMQECDECKGKGKLEEQEDPNDQNCPIEYVGCPYCGGTGETEKESEEREYEND